MGCKIYLININIHNKPEIKISVHGLQILEDG